MFDKERKTITSSNDKMDGEPNRQHAVSSIEMRASQETFNIDKFKDRLYNLSQTAKKEHRDTSLTPELAVHG